MNFNMSEKKTPMPCQDVSERIKNFDEVDFGYDAEQAKQEAMRCLNCKTRPCVKGCPVNNDIPNFIAKIKDGEFEEAYQIIAKASNLPAVCGRVCPQENQCEKNCTRGIKGEPVAIGRLERFVADYHIVNNRKTVRPQSNGHKVAIVGSGPAGLTCAGDLAKKGYEVTVYESLHRPGGVLIYGIPEFCLPNEVVEREITKLIELGVKIETNVVVGKTLTIEEMERNGNEAVFVANGAETPRFMDIPSENLNGVYSANEYLIRINLMRAHKKNTETPILFSKRVAVVGGGNVAIDAARCAVRLGAEKVYIVYRRGENELPARREEVAHAKEEGIEFKFLTNPVRINGKNGFVSSVTCVEMELGEPDSSGRRSPVVKENSEFDIEADAVVMAIGTTPATLVTDTTDGLDTDKKGLIVIDEKGATGRRGVYAGGDAVTGPATVILAMSAGKRAAASIDEYIKSKS